MNAPKTKNSTIKEDIPKSKDEPAPRRVYLNKLKTGTEPDELFESPMSHMDLSNEKLSPTNNKNLSSKRPREPGITTSQLPQPHATISILPIITQQQADQSTLFQLQKEMRKKRKRPA